MDQATNIPVKSAARILDLLELLTIVPFGLRVNETARRLGIPKSSASALIATLEARGYVEAAADGFQLAAAFRDGWVGGPYALLMRVARPVMMRLVERTAESAFLGVLTPNWDVQYVHRVISNQPLRYEAEIGTVRPAYGTSIGHALLAGKDDLAVLAYLQRAPLKKLTPRTIVEPATILKMISKARERGFAPIADSFTLGASGVAAPIVMPTGLSVAALSVIAPTARFEPRRESITEAVVAAAQSIARQMSGNAGSTPGAGRESHER